MQKLINILSSYCVERSIINEKQVPWFKYGIERRLTSIVVGIPFFIFAIALSNIGIAISFHLSFFLLRSRMNGIHADSHWKCLLSSLLLELVFLGWFRRILTPLLIHIIPLICIIPIFILAPYNHPNMNMTHKELLACRKSTRIRGVLLIFVSEIMTFCNVISISIGVLLGVAAAVFLLCLAYIFEGGKQRDKTAGKKE